MLPRQLACRHAGRSDHVGHDAGISANGILLGLVLSRICLSAVRKPIMGKLGVRKRGCWRLSGHVE